MNGKYLITTNEWFIAPDGQQYRAAWGEVEIINDSVLGVKTNRQSTNWFAKVGSEEKHIIIAGCQIYYAVKSANKPSIDLVLDWHLDAQHYREQKTPSRIYFAE